MSTSIKAWAAGWAALVLFGCLNDPELRQCIDFPIGTEGCESGCDVYCNNVLTTCPGLFASRSQCITECSGEPVNPEMDEGEFGERQFNSLSCRLTHLREGQCDNVGLRRGQSGACIGVSCERYCAEMDDNCPGAYPNPEVCEQNCARFPARAAASPAADDHTAECRYRFARSARNDIRGAACDAASLNGGGVCGAEPCVPYCDLVMLNCTGANAVYSDLAECLRVCGFMNGDGRFDDWDFDIEADSVQCRSYHAGPPAAEVPATHCPHTRVYNEEHCGSEPGLNQPADWPCLTFCDITRRECSNFPGPVACRTACSRLSEVTDFDPATGPILFPVDSDICPFP